MGLGDRIFEVMKAIVSTKLVFGCKPELLMLPISNLPAETLKVRVRMRQGEAAVAYVKLPRSISRWLLADDGGSLRLHQLLAYNSR